MSWYSGARMRARVPITHYPSPITHHPSPGPQRVIREQRHGEEDDRAALMGGAERDRHREQQRADAERDLQDERGEQQVRGDPRRRSEIRPAGAEPEPGDQEGEEPGAEPVVEL